MAKGTELFVKQKREGERGKSKHETQ